jgi:hypothetical protein
MIIDWAALSREKGLEDIDAGGGFTHRAEEK